MSNFQNPKFSDADFADFGNPEKNNEERDSYEAYGNVYFAFLDVLGFKQAFDVKKNEEGDIVEKFKEVFIHFFSLMESAHLINNNGCYAGQTSDSLYFYTTDIDQLFNFLKTFSYFNAFSMLKDVYFRGGIAKGSLFYKDPHQFYGKSVVNAYLLESEISKYPIISIDCNTATDMKKQDTELYEYLIESKDYRNYMKPFSYIDCKFSIPVDDQLIKPIDEKDVLTAIEKNLDKFEFNSRNHKKYAFLVDEYKRIKNNIIKEKTDE